MTMNIAIVGSREFKRLKLVKALVKKLPRSATVVSGGADGVDRVAETAAKQRGLETEVFRPHWNEYGISAGHIRNEEIVKASDRIFVFWDGDSKGTAGAILQCIRYNRKCTVFHPDSMSQAEVVKKFKLRARCVIPAEVIVKLVLFKPLTRRKKH